MPTDTRVISGTFCLGEGIQNMGAQASTAINTSIQRSTNEFLQRNDNSCISRAANNVNNVVFIVDGSSIDKIGISQYASTTASCTITNNLDAVSKNVLSAVNQAGAETKRLQLGIAINTTVNVSEQEVKNAITQTITNLCSAESINNTDNVVFAITNSNVKEAIIEQNASAQASCMITNLAKIDAQSQLDVENDANSGGRGKLIIILAVVGGVILLTTAVLGILPSIIGGKKEECKVDPCAGDTGTGLALCRVDNPPSTDYCPVDIPMTSMTPSMTPSAT